MTDAERPLGAILTHVVGVQYYDGDAQPGQSVSFEREPQNPHDPNAIRVDNPDSEQVGHLPRNVASWLAPLLDGGRVRAGGVIPERWSGEPPRPGVEIPLELRISLASKGEGILLHNPDPDSAAGALHELVRAAWENAGRATNPEVVEKTGMGLSALSKRDLLPETRLLLALFPDRARAVERRSGEDVATRIRERLAGIAFGAPVEEQGLTIFPLLAPNGSSPPAVPLSQAIDEGWAEISEVSEEGEIPSLLIDNRGRTPVIVIEGEIFTGLKQDRVVNLTLVAAAGSRSTLPVSCVEQGRWRRSGAGIRSSSYASPRIRAYKTRSVYRRRAVSGTTSSDQAGIWRQVEAQLMGAGASSPTGTLAAAYEASEKRLESLRDALPYPQGACGFLAAQGEQILGLDLFDSPETLERVWRRLADGYFLEALTRAKAAGPIDEAAAARFLEKAAQGLRPSSRQLGAGLELEISGDGIVGSVCWFGGTLCHLSAHPIEEDRR